MLVYLFTLFHIVILGCFWTFSNAEPSHHGGHGHHGHHENIPVFSMPLIRDPNIKHNTSAQVSKMHSRYNSTSRWPAVTLVKANGTLLYYGNISVGVPPQSLTVLFSMDTSFTWLTSTECERGSCLQSKRYNPLSSSTNRYDITKWDDRGSDNSSVSGRLCLDIVRVADVPVRLTFGEATNRSVEFGGVVAIGILGLSSYVRGAERKSFLETAVEKGALNTSVFSMFLNEPAPDGSASGEILFDGFDETKFDGHLTYFNVSGQSGWKVPVEVIPVEITSRTNAPLPSFRGEAVFDPSQEWIAVPEQIFQNFSSALDGLFIRLVTSGRSENQWCLPCPQSDTSKGLRFGNATMGIKFGDTTLHISLAELLGGTCGLTGYYCKPRFQITKEPFWILGHVFFRNFYCVFDNDTIPPRVGVAPLRRS